MIFLHKGDITMKNKENNIGITLKKLRVNSKKNWHYITSKLKEQFSLDIAQSTIYGYENGHSIPNADVFLALCQIYNCQDVLYEFGYTDERNKYLLSNEEERVICNYRTLDDSGQKIIKKALDIK